MFVAHYGMNEFRGTLHLRDAAPLPYFNGFYDLQYSKRTLIELPSIELEPRRRPRTADWIIDVESMPISIAQRDGGYTVWSASADRYHVWTGARRLLRDLWLAARVERGGVAFLHASAVDDGRNLIVFAGEKRAGKTSLMLDATLRNGWRLVSNDCLVLFAGTCCLRVCGLPTYLAIRPDVARRFEPDLLARLSGDKPNLTSYQRWRDAPPLDDEGKVYLSHGVLGRPVFRTIELCTRSVTIVDVGFGPAKCEITVPDPGELSAFLFKNLKPMSLLLKELKLRPAGPLPVDENILTRLGDHAYYMRYRHLGQARPILSSAVSLAGRRCDGRRST